MEEDIPVAPSYEKAYIYDSIMRARRAHTLLVCFLLVTYCGTIPVLSVWHRHGTLSPRRVVSVTTGRDKYAGEGSDRLCDICVRIGSTPTSVVEQFLFETTIRQITVLVADPAGFQPGASASLLRGRSPPSFLS